MRGRPTLRNIVESLHKSFVQRSRLLCDATSNTDDNDLIQHVAFGGDPRHFHGAVSF